MSEGMVIIGGVRYKAEDAKRLGISVRTKDAPKTAAEAEAAKLAAAAPPGEVISSTTANSGSEADAAAAGNDSVNGAADAGTVSGDAGATGDADESASGKPKAAPRTRSGK